MRHSKSYSYKIAPMTIYKAYVVDGAIKVKTSTITDSRDFKYRSDAWYETRAAAIEYYRNTHNINNEIRP